MTDVAENEVKPSEVPPTIEVNDSIPATPEREDSTTAAEDAHRDEVDAIVTAAYLSASKSHAGTSTSEGAVAEREEAVSGYTGAVDDAYDKLNSFCNDHPSVFNKVLNVLDSTWDPKSLDNTFVEVSKVIITGANLLSGVHPFVDVVVTPLRLILTFDQMRRQNNRKVTAVKMQILDTATALFRLRSVPVRKIMGPDGRPLQSLVDIAERIATDIEECSSACDLYLDKSNWSKFLKASEYEKTFADFMIKFSNHKTTLTLELSLHIAVTIEAQDAKIGQEIGTISNKIDALFRQLDTTREREVKRFIETKDGVQACIKSDVALKELAEKCGESLESLVPPRSERADAKRLLEDARKVLNKELLEDVDEAVKKHMNDFARKWRAEQIEVKAQIISSEKHIITVVEGPSSQRVDDIELREIWIEHKWKSSVAPHDFVLALNEYFSRRHHGPVVDNPLDAHIGEVPLSPTSSVGDHQDLKRTDSDQWAIEYINLAHLQPLLDVIDTDGSGLINVYEANRFTRRNIRPENWRLHHWVAFWAAGWHLTVMWYRYKIYNILQTMLKVVGHVKPTNIQAADGYLAGRGIQCVELLLRATRPARAEYAQRDDKQLRILAEEFHKSEEANVKKQLEELRYKLDNIDTIQLVTGALGTQGLRRIEVHVYPPALPTATTPSSCHATGMCGKP
ncbi:Protein kinase domain-containing protein [Mycena sanguinolenta]|uniref:Protein kinase domain-containing protein n=1 Tax=Mycena sanguinolenta TaxID=230812 RepID=A0A8H6ZKN9_9AGAR|nr:Protein kinase domain-containing protein [Mycena sanguinolenta]